MIGRSAGPEFASAPPVGGASLVEREEGSGLGTSSPGRATESA